MATAIVGTRDILWTTPYIDPDVAGYGELPSAKELELRVGATPQGSGALLVRRQSVNLIVTSERTGRNLDLLQGTGGTTPDTNVTAATYSATEPTGYTGNNLELQFASSSTDRGCRKVCVVGASDLSVFSGGAMLRFHRRCTSATNLVRMVVRFEFATSSDYAEFSVFEAADALNTWAEVVVAKGNPRATSGTVNWALFSGTVRFFADVSGAYVGNLELRDLRLGTVETAKTVPDGAFAWETVIDARARYRDDATAKATTTLAATSAPAATNVKVASVSNLAIGDELTLVTAGFVETRTITTVGTAGSGGTGITVSQAYTYGHTSGDTVEVRYWGPWSAWATVKASQPPAVAASTPADAATVTDPTTALVHTYSSPASKLQASRTLRVYQRIAGVDQLIRTTTTAGTGLTDTLPAFLLSTGLTYAWEKTAYDTDGLGATTTRRTFTTSFTAPAVLTNVLATADPGTGSVILTWDASADANHDHYRVYWRDAHGVYVRIDGGPAALDDGLAPLLALTFTHYGASQGDNDYLVTDHTGALESDGAPASASLDTVDPTAGAWSIVRDGEERYTFGLRVLRGPRTRDPSIETFRPPGRGSPQHLTWGLDGRHFDLAVLYRPATEGDLATVLEELLAGGLSFWLKAPAGYLWAPCRVQLMSLADEPLVGGMVNLTLTCDEVAAT
jgi:hypothetical protein